MRLQFFPLTALGFLAFCSSANADLVPLGGFLFPIFPDSDSLFFQLPLNDGDQNHLATASQSAGPLAPSYGLAAWTASAGGTVISPGPGLGGVGAGIQAQITGQGALANESPAYNNVFIDQFGATAQAGFEYVPPPPFVTQQLNELALFAYFYGDLTAGNSLTFNFYGELSGFGFSGTPLSVGFSFTEDTHGPFAGAVEYQSGFVPNFFSALPNPLTITLDVQVVIDRDIAASGFSFNVDPSFGVYEPGTLPTPAPEPATLILLGTATLALLAYGRTHRARVARTSESLPAFFWRTRTETTSAIPTLST